jgi:hypothetical protein
MMNSQDETHIRYPQDVSQNEDGTVTITIRYSFYQKPNRETKITIPKGSKDLLHDIDIILATLKNEDL